MIKNLMFDLGGVIMDLKRDNAVKALQDLGLKDADELLGLYGQKGVFLQLERGEISPEDFRDYLRGCIGRPVSDEAIDEAFCKFLVGIPVDRLHQLEELHRKYGIYLLSNTNPVMWNGFILNEFRKDGHDIDHYFDGIVASFDVHAYKPEPEIFRIAAEKFGILPEETAFYDDSLANAEASSALGFKGIHVENPDRRFDSYL